MTKLGVYAVLRLWTLLFPADAGVSALFGGPVLVGLAGRSPLRYRTSAGKWINNIDITHALKPLAIALFGVHQFADGSITLRLSPGAMPLAGQACAKFTHGAAQLLHLG